LKTGVQRKKGRPRSAVAETKLDGAAGIAYYRLVNIDKSRLNGTFTLDYVDRSTNLNRFRLDSLFPSSNPYSDSFVHTARI
jgi:hypothetical protein